MINNISKFEVNCPSKLLIIMDPCYLNNKDLFKRINKAYHIINDDKELSFINVDFTDKEDNKGLATIIRLNNIVCNKEVYKNEVIEKITLKHQNNDIKQTKVISEICVDSHSVIVYDVEYLLNHWKDETDKSLDKRVSIVTTTLNTNLIKAIQQNFTNIKSYEKNTKHIEEPLNKGERLIVHPITNIRFVFEINANQEQLLLKILEENKTTMLNGYKEHVEITNKSSYYYLSTIRNGLVSLDKNAEILGFKTDSGFGDGVYNIVQGFNKNKELVETSILF